MSDWRAKAFFNQWASIVIQKGNTAAAINVMGKGTMEGFEFIILSI